MIDERTEIIGEAQDYAFDAGFKEGVDYARNFMKDEFKTLKPSEFPKINKI